MDKLMDGWMDGWMDRLTYVLTNRRSINGYYYKTITLQASAIQAEMRLLTASVAMEDTCWEERLKTGLKYPQ